jgi:phosphotransferase system enzyme I (PtsP)
VLEEGSAMSHVAIVARALDIPVVGRAPDVLARVEPGDSIVVDGDNAQVLVRPAEDILQTIYAAIAARDERRRKYAALRDLPSATRDQARISLNMNAGLLIDMQHLEETGADGVGLSAPRFRSWCVRNFPMSMRRPGSIAACSTLPTAGR